ncbi:SAM-dependent methyltransferase [Lottiidibacillus patelloidae]|uniref:SAM-dependent methyltransferase n=1 Tax=Lottiidibacillus patelloidae TaxID=2670334 RepID=A0A263BVY5_9BACI|nr:class I SAM-dependent methyltransferase [Lottiidibacillus patelloidae]OZM57336.1 SAM-dependent methyltransferase [Lottiidibacillus patelloidae]
MDIIEQNKTAWNNKVIENVSYTRAVSKETIKRCKQGDWEITVTTEKSVPRKWFPVNLNGVKILCLASGGGQQGPILAAAGADVTVVDISDKQLEQDQFVATRDKLTIETIQGSMTNLHFFEDESFDIIVHPVSNLFVAELMPVWKEAYRVLKRNGTLISGFTNPLLFIFNDDEEMKGNLKVEHSIPTNSIANLNESQKKEHIKAKRTVEHAHTLEDQIQGQIDAGFMITGFYEDDFGGRRMIDNFIKTFIATKATKC